MIATAYNMGTSLLSATNINIGTVAKTTTTINGTLTVNNGITLSSSYTPTSTQLGYNLYDLSNSGAILTATIQTLFTFTNIPIGVYTFNHSSTLYSFSIGATQVATLQIKVTGGITAPTGALWPKAVLSGVATTFQTSPSISTVLTVTSATNTLFVTCIMTSGGGNCTLSNCLNYLVKIA
jgi:hypothetical protein